MAPFTGPFPKNDKLNMAAFRAAEMRRQGTGYKTAKPADAHLDTQRLTDATTTDPFPSLKSNRDGTSGHGDTRHLKAGKSDLPIKTKARPFGGYASPTPPPKGRALPVRGEHND